MRLHSLGGYNAAKLSRYQDLIERHLTKGHVPVISMLNTRYLVIAGKEGKPEIRVNRDAMGNAWFVEHCLFVDGAQAEDESLMQVDLSTTAVADKSFASIVKDPECPLDPDRHITLTAHTPDSREYEYESSCPGTVIFSEIYYPHGWKATIDGKAVEHFRADYLLRGLSVPAGRHSIRFVFDPDSVRKGDALALPFIILMYLAVALILGVALFRHRINTRDSGSAYNRTSHTC